jgi:hypothetical protein
VAANLQHPFKSKFYLNIIVNYSMTVPSEKMDCWIHHFANSINIILEEDILPAISSAIRSDEPIQVQNV